MTAGAEARRLPAGSNGAYALGLARAVAGAIIFGLPLLMTMEMWWLGFHISPPRLFLFVAFNFVILVGLSRFGGFEPTMTLSEDLLDALAAYGVGILAAAIILILFGILQWGMPLDEWAGKIAVQSVPGSFGAMLARKQLGSGAGEKQEEHALRTEGYPAELFLMLVGALFLTFNVAPTEEMMLISYIMGPAHAFALVALSLLMLHALVYSVGFAGQHDARKGGFIAAFFTYTIPGYGVALLVSLYVLWTFGRADGVDLAGLASIVVVLGFPASIGAAIARLVV
ncbi:MAG: TIGR02587 family membrane protein [Sphingomonas sp.]